MANEPIHCVARVDRRELAEMSPAWTDRERGQFLRLLLRREGIDPGRLYRVEYFPLRRCWLLTQNAEPDEAPAVGSDEQFYAIIVAELRRTARLAWAALAAQSSHFAQSGCEYQLPPKPQELTTAGLADLLGGPGEGGPGVRFDSEGGWHTEPSEN